MREEKTPTPALELPIEEIEAIIERATVGAISPEEYAKLRTVIQTFALLKEELQAKKTSIQRLKQMLFGPSTERTREVLGEGSTDAQATARPGDRSETEPQGAEHGTEFRVRTLPFAQLRILLLQRRQFRQVVVDDIRVRHVVIQIALVVRLSLIEAL